MCCDNERCLPPTEEEFSFSLSAGETATPGTVLESAEKGLGPGADAAGSPESGTGNPVSNKGNIWIFFLVSFLAGLAGILTPCVFPMIPMTVTFFMQGSENRAKAIFKGLIFGISIVVIYTSIGLIVSLTSAGADFANRISSH